MKEVTAIITCEITEIAQVPDDFVIPPVDCVPPYVKLREDLKHEFDADDVNVKLVQFFIRDLPNDPEVAVETP